MIVMKFGGTSLQDVASIRRAVEIVRRQQDRQPLVVASATGRTTQTLVELGRTALAEGSHITAPLLEGLLNHHLGILGDLDVGTDRAAHAQHAIGELGRSIGRLLEGVALLQQLTPRTQDAIMSHGERLSTLLFAAAAGKAGLDAVQVDATRVMITDARFGAARPDRHELGARAKAIIQPLLDEGRVPIVEGFIGATREGVPTTMGFEASDYTASLLGAALDAEEVQIWTDVVGILTTGSNRIANVLSIAELSFEEAAELSFFGAKVLHPRTIDPAVERNIPVRILHSRHPEGAGTNIFGASTQAKGVVKSIAVKDDVAMVRVRSPRPVPVHRTLRFVGETLDRHEVSPHLLAVSGHRVTFVVPRGANLDAAMDELDGSLDVSRDDGCAIVSLVGTDVGHAPRVAAKATGTIKDAPILLVSYGASDTSVSLVVPERDAQEAVAALHREFFGEELPDGVFTRVEGRVFP